MADFTTLLVANRGEIALRVMRTAKALGYRTVAVYSEADAAAPHVKFADDAVLLGPAPAKESYLDPEKIIAAAKAAGAEAIHPGYGFLSENAPFAEACGLAGLAFVGPPPDAIELMGDKARAKRRMIEAGVPCVPGYEGEDQKDETFIKAADEIGYPVMVKAAAGGGGRGMRLVAARKDLENALKLARSEAENAFGDGTLILEKAVVRPRHVEIQVFADTHGHTIHLGERDCSVQRRHQKVVEEAPCPVMTESLRAEMGAAAVKAAESVGYVGAGTVEFLLDADGKFYFLEMNTRLQVEHPVTELVTGLDLVALQLRVARGEPLGIAQDEVRISGHAIEVRLYAEDPEADFLPSTGRIGLWHPPQGPGVRVDAGVESGSEVSPFYDPMIAKVLAHEPTREEARRRLIDALGNTAAFGPRSNRDFLIDVLGRPDFASGEATTAFIAENYGEGAIALPAPESWQIAAAAIAQLLAARDRALDKAVLVSDELLGWSSTGNAVTVYEYAAGEERTHVQVLPQGDAHYRVAIGEAHHEIEVLGRAGAALTLAIDGRRKTALVHVPDQQTVHLAVGARTVSLTNLAAASAQGEEAGGDGTVRAPMHGSLLQIFVEEGATVAKGDKLAVLEAMKMQHEIVAAVAGTVSAIKADAGAQVAADDLILEIEPSETAA